MGKTVPSYRMALEFEIAEWKDFRKALPSDEEREAFDDLMDICRNNAMAAGNACNPVIYGYVYDAGAPNEAAET